MLGSVVDGQTLNRYAYVTGQPVSYIAPFGLSAKYIYNGFMIVFFCFMIGAGVSAIPVATLPISATGMAAIVEAPSSAVGGSLMGVTGYEFFTEENYWNGEKLTPSEVDNRLLGNGCYYSWDGMRLVPHTFS